jgi:hypothetical protein
MMTDLSHAIQFFQTGFTILLGLALGEAFKQLVPDGDQDIRSDRVPLLLAFLFMIFPFFHGMSRYFYTTYLTHPEARLAPVAGHIMFDGLVFMTLGALFFGMCRSLSPAHWVRFYGFLLFLLGVDTIWIVISMVNFKVPLLPWLVLNVVLAAILAIVLLKWGGDSNAPQPLRICAAATLVSTVVGYVWMSNFYFP